MTSSPLIWSSAQIMTPTLSCPHVVIHNRDLDPICPFGGLVLLDRGS